MAKRKGISISLAAKCQLLFGLAVLVIIAGALAVPWQRMEQLAKQPNIKAARFAADVVFRTVHAQAMGPNSPSGVRSGATWDSAILMEGTYAQPRIMLAPLPGKPLKDDSDPIANFAINMFRERPGETEYGKVVTINTAAGEDRIYRFAAAIRLDASCMSCHTEFQPFAAGATLPAARTATSLTSPALTTLPATTTSQPNRTAGAGSGTILGGGPVVGVVRVDVPYQTDENQLLLNRIVIVVAGMLGGALAIVVFYLITSRLILQPVRVLKNTAEKVSNGDLNIRSAISTGDEFQHLSETFNTMLANLQASRDQLQATNRSLDTRVGELASSNVDLYEANRVKSEFLTNVTHELRTPLNAIIGFADLLADTAAKTGDPKQQRYSENIRTSAKQLLDLINDLLDLAKIEAGKLVLREERVNVADACEAMANFMRPLAQKKEIALELFVDSDMPLITTDPGRFQQILYNFLSNAIKFTPPEGRVTISARCQREMVGAVAPTATTDIAATGVPPVPAALVERITGIRISVTDTGPGISPEDQKVIFEKFRQLDGSVTRHHSGSGLGLAISQELTNMLGGKIELVSSLGKGATFSLIMPVDAAAEKAAPHPAAGSPQLTQEPGL